MSNRCPVCKARLWRDPILYRKLKCPRCGAEFRPTVPWIYFQVLFLILSLLGLTVVIAFFHLNIWLIVLFALILGFFLIYLSRMVDIKLIPGDLSVADGPPDRDEIQMKLKYQDWQEEDNLNDYQPGWFFFISIFLVLLVIGIILAVKIFG